MAQIDSSAVMECRIELKYSTKSNSGPQWRSKGYQKVQNQTNIASLLKKKKIAILDGVISLFVLCWLFCLKMYKVYFTNSIVYQGIKRQLTIEFIMICWYNSLYRLKLKQSIGYKSVNIASTMMLWITINYLL